MARGALFGLHRMHGSRGKRRRGKRYRVDRHIQRNGREDERALYGGL